MGLFNIAGHWVKNNIAAIPRSRPVLGLSRNVSSTLLAVAASSFAGATLPSCGCPPDTLVDATPGAPDAAPPTPDATVSVPDAMPPTPDATVSVPDAMPPTPDAMVSVPDAMPPTPDAMVSVPDAMPDAFIPPVDAGIPMCDPLVASGRGTFQLPIGFMAVPPVAAYDKVEAAFGPRSNGIDGNNDFHEGIDIEKDLGTAVFAMGAGTVWGVFPGGHVNHPEWGNFVVVAHPLSSPVTIDIDGVDVDMNWWWTIYANLQNISVVNGDAVAASSLLAEVAQYPGQTGTDGLLHLETRFGTADPALSDPTVDDVADVAPTFVNPVELLEDTTVSNTAPEINAIDWDPVTQELTITARTHSSQQPNIDLDRFRIRLCSGGDNVEVFAQEVSFNGQLSFDPVNLDNFDLGDIVVEPRPFNVPPHRVVKFKVQLGSYLTPGQFATATFEFEDTKGQTSSGSFSAF